MYVCFYSVLNKLLDASLLKFLQFLRIKVFRRYLSLLTLKHVEFRRLKLNFCHYIGIRITPYFSL